MKKKVILFFSIFAFMLSFITGCSSELSKIELIDYTFNYDYIVGDEVEIENFQINVTLKNGNEYLYDVSKEMIEISEIDNTLVGEQQVTISINVNGSIVDLIVDINFDTPNEVKDLIKDIDELNNEIITLEHESDIHYIERTYTELEDFYKNYVTNYNDFVEIKNEYEDLKEELLTISILNERYLQKTSLEKYFNSLKSEDYSLVNWAQIRLIYNRAISEIEKDYNYAEVTNIVTKAKKDIDNVETLKEAAVQSAKERKIQALNNYRNSLGKDNYSIANWTNLNNIVNRYTSIINSLNSEDRLSEHYLSAIKEMDKVLTLDDQAKINFNNMINSKLLELANALSDMNLTIYSLENKNAINIAYNEYYLKIKNSTSEEEADNYIKEYKNYLNAIFTAEEEKIFKFKDYKLKAIEEVRNYHKSIYIYDYDINNQNEMKKIVEDASEKIQLANSETEIDMLVNSAINSLNEVPTINEQLIANLNNVIAAATNRLYTHKESLLESKYSSDKWMDINKIYDDGITLLENDITIHTTQDQVDNMIDAIINNLNEVLTIEEEKAILLENTKVNKINELTDFYNNLEQNSYTESVWETITSRVNTSIATIEGLSEISAINKLVNDTINFIKAI